MRTNPSATAALLAAMAVPANAGEIYSFRASDFALGSNVTRAIEGVTIQVVDHLPTLNPAIVSDPERTNHFDQSFLVPVSAWIFAGANGGCGRDVSGSIVIDFEQPVKYLDIVSFGTFTDEVLVCSGHDPKGESIAIPLKLTEVGVRRIYDYTGRVTFAEPTSTAIVHAAGGFGLVSFHAEGISFVDEPMTGALLLGGVAALAGLRRRRG